MATSVAAALAAELGLRTAAELRPAADARPGREARLAGEPPPTGSLATAPRSAVVAEPRPEAAPDAIQPSRVILPVTPDISALLPYGGLATVTAIMASRRGATSLLWRLLAGPTGAGAWCALVGMPQVYPLAATAAGVDLGRVALVDPGPLVVEAAGTLAEGVAAVVVPSEGLTPTQTRRLAARARKSRTAIIWWETRPVAGADARLEVVRARWQGLRPNAGRRWGAGRLDACELEVAAHWRTGSTREARIWPYGGEAEERRIEPTATRSGERSGRANIIELHSKSAMDRMAADRDGVANRSERFGGAVADLETAAERTAALRLVGGTGDGDRTVPAGGARHDGHGETAASQAAERSTAPRLMSLAGRDDVARSDACAEPNDAPHRADGSVREREAIPDGEVVPLRRSGGEPT